MIPFLHSRRCRLPLAVILLLVTQIAFAGQACRAVMPGTNHSSESAAAATHQMGGAARGSAVADAEPLPCCAHDAPPPLCLVPGDATAATALTGASAAWPDFAPPPDVVLSVAAFDGADAAPSRPARSAAGPPLRVYIVYHRFLS